VSGRCETTGNSDLGCTETGTTGAPKVACGPNGLGEALRYENAENGILRSETELFEFMGGWPDSIDAEGRGPRLLDSHSVELGFTGTGDTGCTISSSSISVSPRSKW
jgi:hypothetical protein